jgi:hypothetical protein
MHKKGDAQNMRSITMDMMAMAYLFDLLSKNRRWDKDFEPRPPSRAKRLGRWLMAAVTSQTGLRDDGRGSRERH